MTKTEELEAKIKQTVALVGVLKQDNQKLKNEVESLRSNLSLFNNENSKAQHILADYEQIRRKHEMVTQKVERALTTLNAMRGGGL